MTQPTICTADLYDDHHKTLKICETQFRCFGKRESFFGPCHTVTTLDDHLPVLRALEQPGMGRVLVVDGGGSMRVGIMGDRLAEKGVRNGWCGVVINGVIRDSQAINALDLGVRALGTTARRGWNPVEATEGTPVQFGGIMFAPGDWVYADRDCVIVSAKELPLEE